MTDRPLDIFVGGAGDRLFRCARNYADSFADAHPERDVVYLPQGRRRRLAKLLSMDRTVNLIGHSWGAADVSWVLERQLATRPPQLAIGIDPVGKPGWMKALDAVKAGSVICVMGTGSEGRLLDGNLTARLGRRIGHACPSAFACSQTVRIDAPYAHYDMPRMMRHAGPDGRSAEERLLATPPT